jgi:hypothetical protein
MSARSAVLSDRVLWNLLWAGVLLALFVCYNIATQSLILGSRDAGWGYGYLRAFDERVLTTALLATLLLATWLFGVPQKRSPIGLWSWH